MRLSSLLPSAGPRGLAVAVALAAVIALSCELTYWMLQTELRTVTLIWPAAGVAMAFFARCGGRAWLPVAIGYCWVFVRWPEVPKLILALIPVLYPLAAWATAWLCYGLKRVPLTRQDESTLPFACWRFLLAPLIAGLPCAFALAFTCEIAGLFPLGELWLRTGQILAADVQGVFALGLPLVALMNGEFRRPRGWRVAGPVVVSLAALIVMAWKFSGNLMPWLSPISSVYLPFPFLVATAILIRPPGITLFICAWCLLSGSLTAASLGPFRAPSDSLNSLELGLYNTLCMAAVYLLSFAAAQWSDQIAQTKMALRVSSTGLWQWSRDHGLFRTQGTPTTEDFFSRLSELPPLEALARLSKAKDWDHFPDSWSFSENCSQDPRFFLGSSGTITRRHKRDNSPLEAIGLVTDMSDYHRANEATAALNQQRALLKSIQLRLNPHFLFNALNAVRATVYKDPVKASQAINSLSRVLRANLHNADRPLIPLEEEITNIRDLIVIANLRFPGRIDSRIDFPDELRTHPIPPMILYNLVENAIVHGVEKRSGPSLLELKLQMQDGHFITEVINDGKLGSTPQAGEGLRNMQQRLEILYGGAAVFELTMPESGKVRAFLDIPIKANAIPDC